MSVRRRLVRVGFCISLVVVSAGNASAHGFGGGHGNDAVTGFTVVLLLPVLAGFLGGVAAIRYSDRRESGKIGWNQRLAIGLLLVGLGTVSLLAAVSGHLLNSVAGGIVGVGLAGWIADGETGPIRGCENHAELTFGAVSAHRLLEGVVLGTLYSAGTAIGLFGAVVLSGHVALETAAVGGLYASTPRRTRAVAAVVLVQIGYVVGGVAGLAITGVVPAPVRTVGLAVVGGVLLGVGVDEMWGASVTGRPATHL